MKKKVLFFVFLFNFLIVVTVLASDITYPDLPADLVKDKYYVVYNYKNITRNEYSSYEILLVSEKQLVAGGSSWTSSSDYTAYKEKGSSWVYMGNNVYFKGKSSANNCEYKSFPFASNFDVLNVDGTVFFTKPPLQKIMGEMETGLGMILETVATVIVIVVSSILFLMALKPSLRVLRVYLRKLVKA